MLEHNYIIVTNLITPRALISPTYLRPIEFRPTRNSTIRSTDPENPTLEPNMKWIGLMDLMELSPFEIFPNERSVGRSSILLILIVLFGTQKQK